MFSFLKKSTQFSHVDKVWKTRQASLRGMITESMKVVAKAGKPIIISWFEDRHQSLMNFLTHHKVPHIVMDEYFEMNEDTSIYILQAGLVAASLHADSLKGRQKTILADGHYPLVEYQNKIVERLGTGESKTPVLYCISLEDPLLKSLGSENIIPLLEKLGLDENECLDHPMIQKAIDRALEKISNVVISEARTNNESEWFIKNVKRS